VVGEDAWSTGAQRGVAAESSNQVLMSVRLDADVIAFFKAMGGGYQTRINDELRKVVAKGLTTRSSGRGQNAAPLSGELDPKDTSAHAMARVTTENPSIRGFLLSEVLRFVEWLARVPVLGVSLSSDRWQETKTIRKMPTCWLRSMTMADLASLATAGRRLKGRAKAATKAPTSSRQSVGQLRRSYLPLA